MSIIDKKQALSQGKPLGGSSKTPLPKKEKDTTAYYGDKFATYGERLGYLRNSEIKNKVYEITHGRVKESDLPKYAKYLGDTSWGKAMEKNRREPGREGRINEAVRKALGSAKNDAERIRTKQDIEVGKLIFGPGGKSGGKK